MFPSGYFHFDAKQYQNFIVIKQIFIFLEIPDFKKKVEIKLEKKHLCYLNKLSKDIKSHD